MMPEGPEVFTQVEGLNSRYLEKGSNVVWDLTDAAIMGGRYRDSPQQREASNFGELKESLPLRLSAISCKGGAGASGIKPNWPAQGPPPGQRVAGFTEVQGPRLTGGAEDVSKPQSRP